MRPFLLTKFLIEPTRQPINYTGFRRTMSTALKAAGITDFRIHDLRHDFASKLLRATQDLALVKNAPKQADISSTIRYAHVLDEDVRDGLEELETRLPLAGRGAKWYVLFHSEAASVIAPFFVCVKP